MQTRESAPEDAAAIARIYNAGIAERIATFETEPRSPEDVVPWIEDPHPAVVVVEGGEIISLASTSAYSPRDCYAGIAEFSVYTDPACRGRGAGRLATEALILEAGSRGYWKLLAKVFVENSPSLNLLRSLGFREVGVHRRHARLDGAWRDVVIVEKLIAQEELAPHNRPRTPET